MAWTRVAGPLTGGDTTISDDALLADVFEDAGSGFVRTGRAAVKVTSTSTVLAVDPSTLSSTYRLFGLDYDTIAASLGGGFGDEGNDTDTFGDAAAQAAWADRFARNVDVVKWHTFITSAAPEGTFWMRNRYETDATVAYHPLYQTRVPLYRKSWHALSGEECALVPVAYDASTGVGSSIHDATATGAEEFAIVYKDPFLLEIASGDCAGWWLILSRYRTALDSTDPDAVPSISPDNSIGDIVAFWSASADFRADDVVGPIRLMGSTNCVREGGVPGGAMVSDVRMWLGTAGAAVVTAAMSGEEEDQLFLYYVVKGCTAFLSETDKAGAPVLDYDGVALDSADPAQLAQFVSSVLAARGVEEGVWLAKIKLGELAFTLALAASAPDTYLDEFAWGDLHGSWPRVNGEVAGMVRVWTVADWRISSPDIRTSYFATSSSGATYTVVTVQPRCTAA